MKTDTHRGESHMNTHTPGEEYHLTIEAEIRVMLLHIKEHHGSPATIKSRKVSTVLLTP
jgi:hypothetical protein